MNTGINDKALWQARNVNLLTEKRTTAAFGIICLVVTICWRQKQRWRQHAVLNVDLEGALSFSPTSHTESNEDSDKHVA